MFPVFEDFAAFALAQILEVSGAGREAEREIVPLGGGPYKFSEQDVKLIKTLVESGPPIKSLADSWGV